MRRGIILAGGSGTRLHPLTLAVTKQLLPVYDKPMIYYPLSTLMLAGIREILIITTPEDQAALPAPARRRLAAGACSSSYAVQPQPGRPGRRPSSSARTSSPASPASLVLGDNIFYGHGLQPTAAGAPTRATTAPRSSAIWCSDPERYGVVEFDADGTRARHRGEAGAAEVELRGHRPLFLRRPRRRDRQDAEALARAASWRSPTLNRVYLDAGELNVELLGRGFAWLDTGTHDCLLEAGEFIRAVEQRQGLKDRLPRGDRLPQRLDRRRSSCASWPTALAKSGYGQYLRELAERPPSADDAANRARSERRWKGRLSV